MSRSVEYQNISKDCSPFLCDYFEKTVLSFSKALFVEV